VPAHARVGPFLTRAPLRSLSLVFGGRSGARPSRTSCANRVSAAQAGASHPPLVAREGVERAFGAIWILFDAAERCATDDRLGLSRVRPRALRGWRSGHRSRRTGLCSTVGSNLQRMPDHGTGRADGLLILHGCYPVLWGRMATFRGWGRMEQGRRSPPNKAMKLTSACPSAWLERSARSPRASARWRSQLIAGVRRTIRQCEPHGSDWCPTW
jgi:hypothetical protein